MSEEALVTVLKSLPLFAQNFLKIRTKSGRIEKFVFNRAQEHIHERLEEQKLLTGKVRALILKGRQQGCCFAPHMRVLTSDYRWVKIGDVKAGDELIGCDEQVCMASSTGRKQKRKLKTTVVEHVETFEKLVYEVMFDNGVCLQVSGDHRMLCRSRGGDYSSWRTIDELDVGRKIRSITRPPSGALRADEAKWLQDLRDNNAFSPSFEKTYEGMVLPLKSKEDGVDEWATIVSITPLQIKAVVDLQTSTKTYICEGLVSHNSTYIQARDFHIVSTTRGMKAFIITHDAEATKNLFDMTKRYNDELPQGLIPTPDTSSAKELKFNVLNSSYAVGTAGNKSVGRSQTIQLFHGSEVGYWPHAEEHAKGILQAVSNEPGTEIILESTANGIGNYFYNMWVGATTGKSDFQAIFIPWYWQPEYTRTLREDENQNLTDEERQLFDQFGEDGLTKNHLYWRRQKLSEFSNDHETAKELFHVEYPMTALDAFRNPVADRFIKADMVNRARKAKITSESPLVIGVDPAISDHDRTAIIRRKGRLAYNMETHFNLNTMELVGTIRRIIDKERPAKVCIDCIGIGAGIVDRLLEIGYDMVEGINVARSANDKDKFKNLRAELWHDMREWFAGEMPVQIPDSDELLGDLTSLGYKFDSSGRLLIESKDDLRKRGMKSPDTADALALTFYVGDYLTGGSYRANHLPENSAGMFT